MRHTTVSWALLGLLAAVAVLPSATHAATYPVPQECTDAVHVLRNSTNEWKLCLSMAAVNASGICGTMAPYSLCVCTACQASFDNMIAKYGAVRNNAYCYQALGDDTTFVTVFRNVVGLVQQWPCFVQRTDCSNPDARPFCDASSTFSVALRGAGQRTVAVCLQSLRTSCERNPQQPFCACKSGVCSTTSVNTTVSPTRDISLFDVMCSPTSPFAAAMNVGPYAAAITNRTYGAPVALLPEHPEWSSPPAVWSQEGCDATGKPVVRHLGALDYCGPGYHCPIVEGHVSTVAICPAGSYCPDAFSDPIPCPKGSFCPAALTRPIKCGFLDVCPAKAKIRVPFAGLVATIIIVVVLVVGYKLYRRAELRRWAEEAARDEKSAGKGAARSGPDTPLVSGMASPRSYGAAFVAAVHGGDTTPSFPRPSKVSPTSLPATASTMLRAPEMQLDIEFDSLGVDLPPKQKWTRVFKRSPPQGKTIMRGVSGAFRSGRVAAIMGPSGAGKTTLITCLLGEAKRSSGTVRVNGREEELDRYRRITGFVPQENIMHAHLTVAEVLRTSARLRLPSSWTSEEIEAQVEGVLRVLNLSHVRNTQVGDEVLRGISGGQKKRVNIGMELVANPALIVLDEPTTGLDATSSLEVCAHLKTIASSGRTVVAVIHQPRYEILKMFDDLLILGRGGRTVFNGPCADAVAYFTSIGFSLPKTVNPADWFLDITMGKVPRNGAPFDPAELPALWESGTVAVALGRASEAGPSKGGDADVDVVAIPVDGPSETQPPAPAPAATHKSSSCGGLVRETPGLLRQAAVFMERALRQKYRQPSVTAIFIAVHCVCALALGAGFSQGSRLYLPPLPDWVADYCPPSLQSYCRERPLFNMGVQQSSFFFSLALGSAAVIIAVLAFGDELHIYRREARSGTSTLAYFVGKNVAEIPWIVLGALTFSGVLIILLRPITSYGDFFAIAVLLECTAWGLGYLASVIFPKESAHVVGVVAIFAMCVCSGLTPSLKKVQDDFSVARVIWDISFPRYVVEAAYVKVVAPYVEYSSPFREAVLVTLDKIGYDANNYSFDLGILFLIGVAYRVIAFFCLRRHSR